MELLLKLDSTDDVHDDVLLFRSTTSPSVVDCFLLKLFCFVVVFFFKSFIFVRSARLSILNGLAFSLANRMSTCD